MQTKVFKRIIFKSLPSHPLMVASFQVLTIYAINVNITNISTVTVLLSMAISITLLFFLFLSYITNDVKRAAIVVTFFCFLFFTYGRLYDVISVLSMFKGVTGRHRYLLPLYIIVAIFGTLWIYRSQLFVKYIETVTYFLNMSGIALVLVAVSMAIINFDWITFGRDISTKSNNSVNKNEDDRGSQGKIKDIQPNVYFIIFDSYSSHKVLNKYYDWDDSGVVDALRAHGFIVNKNAYSNYPFTYLSVAATLNMQYIHEDQGFIDAISKKGYLSSHIKQNKVTERFKSEGYEISINGGFFQKINRAVNNKASIFQDEFVDLVIQISILRILESKYILDRNRMDIINQIEYLKFSNVPKKPTFIFEHVLCPHFPQSFKADGSKPEFYDLYQGTYEKNNYIEQVRFIGAQIIEIIDSIILRDPKAVIIVQSDHGFGAPMGNHLLNHTMPPIEFIDAQYGIISAIYTPPDFIIPERITPVNLFRYVFNNLFDAKYEIFPDRAFFTRYIEPYAFYEVTDQIKQLTGEQTGANEHHISHPSHGNWRSDHRSHDLRPNAAVPLGVAVVPREARGAACVGDPGEDPARSPIGLRLPDNGQWGLTEEGIARPVQWYKRSVQ